MASDSLVSFHHSNPLSRETYRLSDRSKWGIIACVVGAVVGGIFIVLGGVGLFGEARSIGFIASVGGGCGVLGIITSSGIWIVVAHHRKQYTEKLKHVHWYCDNDLSRQRLTLYIQDNQLSHKYREACDPAPHEKLVLVIKVIPYSYLDWSDPASRAIQIIKKHQENMGNRFLVLFDTGELDYFELPRTEPWQTLLAGGQLLRTNSSGWDRNLDAFITR